MGHGMNKIWLAIGAAAVVAGGFGMTRLGDDAPKTATPEAGSTAIASVTVPDTLSANAVIGKTVYDAKCAACHAPSGVGQVDMAPPLVHIIYEPSHHGDEAFQRAAAFGVRAHHWRFGDMPPVKGVTRGDVTMVVAYIRELQRANGIN